MRYAVLGYLLCRGLVCAMPCRYLLCRVRRYVLCRGFVDNFCRPAAALSLRQTRVVELYSTGALRVDLFICTPAVSSTSQTGR